MGCDPAHNGGFVCGVDELPLHTVTLDAYQIAKYEVTNAAYAQCVAAKICKAPYSNASFTRTSYYGNSTYDNYPVIYVDWNQSNTYCAWKGNRLPSEAEWEKAARGATIQAYPWGDFSATCGLANFWLGTSGCVGDTSAVGSYPAGASTYGALDMLGNVWEWVNDWYAGTYYDDPAAGTNPTGPATGYNKVRRGGDFASTGFYLRDATRGIYPPIYFDRFGFRCAR